MLNINFVIIGGAFVLLSILLMLIVALRVRIELRRYNRGASYADETMQRIERLRDKIPFYGALMLLGIIIASLNLFTET